MKIAGQAYRPAGVRTILTIQKGALMTTLKLFLKLCLCLSLTTLPLASVYADEDSNTKITPVITVTPNLISGARTSSTFVCVTNGNPSSTKTMRQGDSFTLTFDSSIGTLASFEPVVMVNSAILGPADFLVTSGTTTNQIIINYIGTNSVMKLRGTDGAFLGGVGGLLSPNGIAFDGANMWIACSASNSVRKIRASDFAELGSFSVGSNP